MHVLVGSVHHPRHEWSYEGECGPQTWQKNFVGARGRHQSPINIETNLAKYDPVLIERPLLIDYDHHSCSQIKNTGYTFQVDSYTTNLSSKYIFIWEIKSLFDLLSLIIHRIILLKDKESFLYLLFGESCIHKIIKLVKKLLYLILFKQTMK